MGYDFNRNDWRLLCPRFEDKLRYLRLAKEFTQSNNIEELIRVSDRIGDYLNGEVSENSFEDNFRGVFRHPCKDGPQKFLMNVFQQRMFRHIEENPRSLIVQARGIGVSTFFEQYALGLALSKTCRIAVFCPKLVHCMEIIEGIIYSYDNSVAYSGSNIFITRKNKTSIAFSNGSTIDAISFSPTIGCAKSVDYVFVDNMVFLPFAYEKDFWNSLQPIVVPDGKLIISSCPNLARGLFYDLYRSNDFANLELPILLDMEMASKRLSLFQTMGEDQWRRDFMCKFIDTAVSTCV